MNFSFWACTFLSFLKLCNSHLMVVEDGMWQGWDKKRKEAG